MSFSEGLYEKDKKQLARALLEVATMKDNTYNLIRSVWNDVQEDWPFYTEQDRQILKRLVLSIKNFSLLRY